MSHVAQGRCVVTREEMRRYVAEHPMEWPELSRERRERLAGLFAPVVAQVAGRLAAGVRVLSRAEAA